MHNMLENTLSVDKSTEKTDDSAAIDVISRFSERLNKILDQASFPGINAGRYSTLGAKYGVPRQQAHRWCTGQAIPSPHILIKIAVDFDTTIDWLFGVALRAAAGIEVPLFRLISPDVEAATANFQMLGRMRFMHSSPIAEHNYAILQNWAESIDPPFSFGEELLINLDAQELEEGACYVIRTAISTSVRVFTFDKDGATLHFHRTTKSNTFTSSYQIHEIHLNTERKFDTDWRQPGILLLGRVEASMHSLLPLTPSFFSDQK
jgi:hypothetical protein